MKLSTLRRARATGVPGVSGAARVDRQTRAVVKRVAAGDIAIIDHVDLDHASATAFVDARVAAVVNVAPSVSGRYPNLGPDVLLRAGIPLVDNVDPGLLSTVSDGDILRIDGGDIYRGAERIAAGRLQDRESVAKSLDASRGGIATQLDALTANAVNYSVREQALLVNGDGIPRIRTDFSDRHVVVVQRRFEYQRELSSLKTYIRENSPVLVAVGAGADALSQAGYWPDLIVLDVDDDEVSESALRSGAVIVVRVGVGEPTLAADLLHRLGVEFTSFNMSATAEDAAIMLASTGGARLIVTCGSHRSMVELLDIGRSKMASSLVTRAAAGSRLVNASAVAQLYRQRIATWLVLLLAVVGIVAVAAAIATTPVGQDWLQQLTQQVHQLYSNVRDRL